ncbi:holo-[acyl-carrier-protein] synthase [Enterococcus florum]|uniref:Holo-[acyl-carrier-protein] synthase n=1 Tax=Enterococcus florum TaxID=2480627 RepID=A0A4P5P7E0_9ENTE|nr:holo-ACP synthase [Enterococcus florum]GCF93895.1 holo-[acyl-carrier-protein] synthase [Enterococcus florum]
MIKGIGIDAVDLVRMTEIIQKKPQFADRVLTKKELELYTSHSAHRQVEFLAGRYACKEAFSKAWGTGIGKVSFQDLEILRDEAGAPVFTRSPHHGKVFVTVTHTDTVAIAQVLLED